MQPLIKTRHILHKSFDYIDTEFPVDCATLTTPCGDNYNKRHPAKSSRQATPPYRKDWRYSNFMFEVVILTSSQSLFSGLVPYFLTNKSAIDITNFLILAESPTVQYTQRLALNINWENKHNDKLVHSIYKDLEEYDNKHNLARSKWCREEEALKIITQRALLKLQHRFTYLRRLSFPAGISDDAVREQMFNDVLPNLHYLEQLSWPSFGYDWEKKKSDPNYDKYQFPKKNNFLDNAKVFKQLPRLVDLEFTVADNSIKHTQLMGALQGVAQASLKKLSIHLSGKTFFSGEMLKMIGTAKGASLEELTIYNFKIVSPNDLDHLLLFSRIRTLGLNGLSVPLQHQQQYQNSWAYSSGSMPTNGDDDDEDLDNETLDKIYEKFSNIHRAFGGCLEKLTISQISFPDPLQKHIYHLLLGKGDQISNNENAAVSSSSSSSSLVRFPSLRELDISVNPPGGYNGHNSTIRSDFLLLFDPDVLPSLELLKVYSQYGQDLSFEIGAEWVSSHETNCKSLHIKFLDDVLPRFSCLKQLWIPSTRIICTNGELSGSDGSSSSHNISASILRLMMPRFCDFADRLEYFEVKPIYYADASSSSTNPMTMLSFDQHTLKRLHTSFSVEEFLKTGNDSPISSLDENFALGDKIRRLSFRAHHYDDAFLAFLCRDKNLQKSLDCLDLTTNFPHNSWSQSTYQRNTTATNSSSPSISDRGILELAHLGPAQKLTSLIIPQLTNITDDGLNAVLPKLTQLSSLTLTGCKKITDNVFDGISHLYHLDTLDIENTEIKGSKFHVLAENCPFLSCLFINDCYKIADIDIMKQLNSCQSLCYVEAYSAGFWDSCYQDTSEEEDAKREGLIESYKEQLKREFPELEDDMSNDEVLNAYLENECLPDAMKKNQLYVNTPA